MQVHSGEPMSVDAKPGGGRGVSAAPEESALLRHLESGDVRRLPRRGCFFPPGGKRIGPVNLAEPFT